MKCIIIDDESTARFILKNLCKKIKNLKIEKEFENAYSALPFLESNKVDLILLDIHMPKLNGYEFINKLENPPKIILTTIDRESAIKAFEYSCIVDYIGKPFKFTRFLKAIDKVKKQTQLPKTLQKTELNYSTNKNINNTSFFVNVNRKLTKIEFKEIYFIRTYKKGIEITTENKTYIVRLSLQIISQKLPETIFFRINQSCVINIFKIINIENGNVFIKGNRIPVSRQHKAELLRILNLC